MNVAKRLAAKLPRSVRQELRRARSFQLMKTGGFRSHEPEYNLLSTLIGEGDWVADIGANVGHYTMRMSALAGATGRIIAFEPVPDTFEILAANCRFAVHQNITLVNAAAARTSSISAMELPDFDSCLPNYYDARLSGTGTLKVFCFSLDSLGLPHRLRLVKIDAEGFEYEVLGGMGEILRRDKPILIVEGQPEQFRELLAPYGYKGTHLKGSPNSVFSTESTVGFALT